MNSIYTLINTKRLHNFSWSLVLLISFREDFKVNAQGLSDNSGEYSQNSLMAYVVVSSLGVAVTIMFLCYLYLREQSGCCYKKRKNMSQDLQATNTVDIAHSEIYSGVYHSSSGFQSGHNHTVEMHDLDTEKMGQEEEDPPPSYESVIGIGKV